MNTSKPRDNQEIIVPNSTLPVPSDATIFSLDAFWIQYNLSLTTWFVFTLILTFTCGLINVIFFAVICTTKSLRTGSGVLIGHLTMIDMMMCIVHTPIYITGIFVHSQSLFTCRFTQFLYPLTNTAGFWNLFFLAVNRFVACVYPLHYHTLVQRRFLASFIVSMWVIGVSLAIPMEFDVNGGIGINHLWGGCSVSEFKVGRFDYRFVQATLATYVPIVLAAVLYIVILLNSWWKSSRTVEDEHSAVQRSQRHKLAMSKMLFASAISYSVFFFAYPVVAKSMPATVFLAYPIMQHWMTTVYVIGHAVHPVFLMVNSRSHRKGIQGLLRRILGRSEPDNSVDHSAGATLRSAVVSANA